MQASTSIQPTDGGGVHCLLAQTNHQKSDHLRVGTVSINI